MTQFRMFFFFLAYPKSPFERELQRLLNESAKNKMMLSTHGAPSNHKTNNLDSTKRNVSSSSNGNNNNGAGGNGLYEKTKTSVVGSLPSSSTASNNNNNIRMRDIDDNSCIDTNSLKHPVGLEAIKELARNKNIESLS
jgi:adenylate cyclase 1